MSQPDLAYSFTDVLSLQPSDALTDWKQMTWPRIHTVDPDHAIATIWMVSCHSINVSVNKYIGVWVFFSNVMVHLCAVATSICFLFKHKYARFYSILLALNGIFIPLTVGLITSREYSKNMFIQWQNDFSCHFWCLSHCKLGNGSLDGITLGCRPSEYLICSYHKYKFTWNCFICIF